MAAKEIRLHGRGGQGAVMAAKMLASAFSIEGKYVATFPMYGFERRGMPVIAFTRFDTEPILEKTQIYTPDLLMVIDPTLLGLKSLFEGLKPGGILILNRDKALAERPIENLEKVGFVDATGIAMCEIGRDIPNTCLLGALVKTTGWLDLESLLSALGEYLEGSMLEKNIHNATRGYEEAGVQTWDSQKNRKSVFWKPRPAGRMQTRTCCAWAPAAGVPKDPLSIMKSAIAAVSALSFARPNACKKMVKRLHPISNSAKAAVSVPKNALEGPSE